MKYVFLVVIASIVLLGSMNKTESQSFGIFQVGKTVTSTNFLLDGTPGSFLLDGSAGKLIAQ